MRQYQCGKGHGSMIALPQSRESKEESALLAVSCWDCAAMVSDDSTLVSTHLLLFHWCDDKQLWERVGEDSSVCRK